MTAAPSGIGFWDLPDHAMKSMLALPPRKVEDRYARLRQSFNGAGCAGDSLSDLVLESDKGHSILVCTLPGATPFRIVVEAALQRREFFSGSEADGWPDAAILPMLYHALKAQPRQATFVFAALSGDRDRGDTDFQNHLEAGGAAAPLALVGLYGIGFGIPEFANLGEGELDAKARPNAEALQTEAWRMRALLHINPTHDSVGGQFAPQSTIRIMVVRDGPRDLPHIIFYSNPATMPGQAPDVTLTAFHREYEYLAYYLADIDRKLTRPSQ